MSAATGPVFPGDSEMARRMRELDWSRTELGPVSSWPTSLKTTVGVLLGNRFPMSLLWGPSLININNDAYRPVLGDKHPASLGASVPEIWKEIWHIVGAQLEGVLAGAPATWNEHMLLPINLSNVSHEFRTPLTLMLGPLDEALGSPDASLAGENLRAVHRNALRLLKLVNALLDFARIEAGRARACYVPVDLAAETSDLASAFRSTMERGGLRFEVDCPTLEQPVYADRDMWEKLVANLLSNAFKFTFEGLVRVQLRARGDHAELTVADTGVGIGEHELPRLAERFHRVPGTRARTYEGSGIGLALVHEIVRLHGGSLSATSKLGEGTIFTVAIPFGKAHLPEEQIGGATSLASTAVGAEAFVQEALRWLPDAAPDSLVAQPAASSAPDADGPVSARVLVADDNADMREYLTRLLSPQWTVRTAMDGVQALAIARDWSPDLVIADIMMPNLDGFGLLAALRADAATADKPVIMLSARAGEESRVEGLRAGADDYLVKPFSARELVARAAAQIQLARTRAESKRQHERLRRFLMDAPFAIVWLEGPEYRVVLSNPRHQALHAGRDMTGMKLVEALPELEGQEGLQVLARVYESGESVALSELPIPLERGGRLEQRWFTLLYEPVRDERGVIEGVLCCAIDVTSHQLARLELEDARELAESATRAKDEFLALLGHELRNPLAPILTAIHLMRMRGMTGRELDVIARQVDQLGRLVDDLLDLSRITRAKLELRKQRIELASAVVRGLEIASPLVEQRRQRLELDVAPEGLLIDGDLDRLAQVVSNLITNAAKYSGPGTTISVSARRTEAWVTLSVRDQGIGIAPEMLGRIFDTFVQQPQALDRSKGGLGIGLAIVRSLTQLHGGRVYAESAGPGRGSEFIVELPPAAEETCALPMPERAAAPSPAAPQRIAKRVLVVDDNVDAASGIAELLSAQGHQVQVAYDGPTALGIARELKPDVCMLDIGLPVMDGYELARKLRESVELPADARMVAITGYGGEADRRRTAAVGFDAHLVKPVPVEALTRAVGQ